jgi:uncharacterized protein GlcG (DUF336 family)
LPVMTRLSADVWEKNSRKDDMNVLTLNDADRMLHAAIAKAEEFGVHVSVSIVDPRGDLITMARMDGTKWRTIPLSHGKAYVSATWEQPSSQLQERADEPIVRSLIMIEGGHLVPVKGGLPIFRDGVLIGAIATGGASMDQDEDISTAGLAVL